MSNYVKGQVFSSFADSDADPAVFDTEFASVAVASATKLDKTGGTMTGAITLPAGSTGAQAIQAQEVVAFSFVTGVKMAFFQATAPVGWTQDVANNDALLRVVSTAGGGVGGSVSPISGLTLTDAHVLTITEMPAHTHSVPNSGSQNNSFDSGTFVGNDVVGVSGSTGGDGGHTHSITYSPKYIDMIVCQKD